MTTTITTAAELDALPDRFRFSEAVYGVPVATAATRVLLALTDGGHGCPVSDHLRWAAITAAQALDSPDTPAQPTPAPVDGDGRLEAVSEEGHQALRANRDYWRRLAEAKVADWRDLRAALRDALGLTGPTPDERLIEALPAALAAARAGEAVDRVAVLVAIRGKCISDAAAEAATDEVMALFAARGDAAVPSVTGERVRVLHRFVFEDPDVEPSEEFVRLADVLALIEVAP